MTTTIECTKSKFAARLDVEYVQNVKLNNATLGELMDVINGLVRLANEHRGTFEGHSAYLDLDFIVHPDAPIVEVWYDATDGEIITDQQLDALVSSGRAVIVDNGRTDGATVIRLEIDGMLPRAYARVSDIDLRPIATPSTLAALDRAKCADCNAPAVQVSAVEPSHGTDTTPKPRCERHALPVKFVGRETVWCEAHPGVHYDQDTCVHPHHTGPAQYAPSPAVRAMIVHLAKRRSDGDADNPLTPTYARFRMLIEGIKAEMPNWTDVQARDWLSAQIR